MHNFEYQKVFSLAEAYNVFADSGGTSSYMAGGTDLLVQIKEGTIGPQRVIDVKGIPDLDACDASEVEFTIGSLTTVRNLETSPLVREKIPLLAQCASKLGSVQVRNRATVGGNICNAAPSAETAPGLLALDAQAEIYGKQGTRVVDLVKFFSGPGSTILGEGEILTGLKIPLTQACQGSVYYKLATRKAMDIAFVGVAVLVELDGDDRITKARIALGAVSPTPLRVPSAEKVLEGSALTTETAREAADLAARACLPISDIRASAAYRTEMVNNLCQRGLVEAYAQAKGSGEGERR